MLILILILILLRLSEPEEREGETVEQATKSVIGASRQQPLLLRLPMKLLRLRNERRERKISTQQQSQLKANLH